MTIIRILIYRLFQQEERLKPKQMPNEVGFVRNKFCSHVVIEIVLVAALVLYMVLAQEKAVGEDLAFTVAGAGLMALVTYWTLNTLRDGLEVIAVRTRGLRH